MNSKDIKAKLETIGYFVSPNYGLIAEKSNLEYFIADIRKCEDSVFVPYIGKVTAEKTELMKTLAEQGIPFRNQHYKEED